MSFLGLIPDYDSSVELRLTPEQVKREATGRALALMGSVIGMVGGIMILSTNPAFKGEAQGVWKKLPKEVQENKAMAIMGAGLLVAGAVYMSLMRGNQRRYG
jgi:hypothetical protein